MSRKTKAVPSDIDNGSNTLWINERLAHEKQRRLYKKLSFWFAGIVSVALYIAFGAGLYKFSCDEAFKNMFLQHTHIMAIWLALLIVPTVILWGIVRAVFNVGQSQVASELIKPFTSMHPLN